MNIWDDSIIWTSRKHKLIVKRKHQKNFNWFIFYFQMKLNLFVLFLFLLFMFFLFFSLFWVFSFLIVDKKFPLFSIYFTYFSWLLPEMIWIQMTQIHLFFLLWVNGNRPRVTFELKNIKWKRTKKREKINKEKARKMNIFKNNFKWMRKTIIAFDWHFIWLWNTTHEKDQS